MDCSPPGSSVHGILQARVPEWVAILFSVGFTWPRDRTGASCTAGRFFNIWATRERKWKWKWKSQSYPTLWNPMDHTVHGILQARLLEWVVVPFSRGSSQNQEWNRGHLYCGWILCQLSQPGKPKNSGVGKPNPSPEDLPNPGIEPGSPALQADSLPAELSEKPD